jgi:hypothetical protein
MRSMISSSRIRAASRAALVHLGLSALVGLAAAALVFGLWFPYPYRHLVGGQNLFLILVGVDVVCGPLLTSVLFTPRKSRRELALDLSLIALVQLAALGYGVHVISEARPVVLAFEADRFVAVTATQVATKDLPEAPPQFRKLSWSGPVLVGTRAAKEGESLSSVMMSVQGVEPSARPGWWQPYEENLPQVKQRMKPLADLRAAREPTAQEAIDAAVAKVGQRIGDLSYLPMTSKKMLDGWVALLDRDARIVGYAPVDGF